MKKIYATGILYIVIMIFTLELILFTAKISHFFKEIIFISMTVIFFTVVMIIIKKVKTKDEDFYEKAVKNAPILMCVKDKDG